MPTTIKCIRGLIEENLSEGNAIFVSELVKYRDALRAVGFNGSPLPVERKEDGSLVMPVENSLACIDLEGERVIKRLDELHELVFATLNAFRDLGVKTFSMNGIKYYPDISNSRKYQRQFVEEYVAAHPDAFDTICLVDKYGEFGRNRSNKGTKKQVKTERVNGDAMNNHADHLFIPAINLGGAIATLRRRESDIRTYLEIMQMAENPNNPEFQRKYDAFYRVRRNQAWRNEYFNLMSVFRRRNNPTFGEILRCLQKRTQQVESSFSSKMLATLDANKPIWDSKVLTALNLKLTGNSSELKMLNAERLYDRICNWYDAFLQTENARRMIESFNNEFNGFNGLMSPTKIIDFILWANE
jgi:hypothetical protein